MAFIKELNLLMNMSLDPANTCSTINDLQFLLLSLTYDIYYEHVCMLQLQPNLKTCSVTCCCLHSYYNSSQFV